MFFLNEVLELNIDLLGEVPKFQWRSLKVINPLAGTGKKRHIAMPNPPMRIVHKRLRQWIETLPASYRYATAFRAGDSARKNVELHRGNQYFLITDIRSAFQSVWRSTLMEIFVHYGQLQKNRQDVDEFLSEFCFDSQVRGLIVGAPASPALFNLYCTQTMDRRIGDICRELGGTFTRYGDDCTISSSRPITRKTRKAIYGVIRDAGFEINDAKTGVRDLAKGPIIVTGISLALGGKISVPQSFLRETEEMLQFARQERHITPVLVGRIGAVIGAVGKHPDSRRELRLLQSFRTLRRSVRALNRQKQVT